MKHLQRLTAGFLLVIALSITAFAGETSTPPGETHTPPGETSGPPAAQGETQGLGIMGEILTPGIINAIFSLM